MGIVKENLEKLNTRIKEIASRVDRNPDDIKLIAVTKTATIDQIKEAISAGVKMIGENKVQEAQKKYQIFANDNIEWHLVGHLQTNKVKFAVEMFDLIHSVDSLKLAKEIDKRSIQFEKTTDILIEVNVSGEKTKYGIRPEELEYFLKGINEFSGIRIRGLMTIAPIVMNKEEVRPYFSKLRELTEKINTIAIKNVRLNYLSMGMTDDYEIAIEEGANMIRIGRGIFGY